MPVSNVNGQYKHLFDIGTDEPLYDNFSFYRPTAVAVDSAGNQYISDTYNDRIQIFNSGGKLIRKIGRRGSGDGEFDRPAGIALDRARNLYVCDQVNSRIQVFDGTGGFIRKFGIEGVGDGQFWSPVAIAIGKNAEIFVVDLELHRIQVFDSLGVFSRKFGSPGSADGELLNPSGIAISKDGYVIVSDGGNSRMQVFTAEGTFVRKFGSVGGNDGELKYPAHLAVDSANIYVADQGNNRIQIFDINGAFIEKFGSMGSAAGQFLNPAGIAVDNNGNRIIVDEDNDRIQIFQPDGAFIKEFGQRGNGSVSLNTPGGLVSHGDKIYVTDYFLNTLTVLDASGNIIRTIDDNLSGPGHLAVDDVGNIYVASNYGVEVFDSDDTFIRQISGGGLVSPGGIALSDNGNIYVSETTDDKIIVFSNSGSYLFSFGSSGTGEGQFELPYNIYYYSNEIYVVDNGNSRIQIFDQQGNFVRKVGTLGDLDGELRSPTSIAIDPLTGNIYVAQSTTADHSMVQIFDNEGLFISKFGTPGDGAGEFLAYLEIAVTSFGDVLVADLAGRIQRFDESGNYITVLGNSLSSNGQILPPEKMDIDHAGNIYISDIHNRRVVVFDENGEFKKMFGSFGSGDGQFSNGPYGVAVDNNGKIYATEPHRVQVFDNDGNFIRSFGSLGSSDGQFQNALDVSVDDEGNIYVLDESNHRVQVFDGDGNFIRKFGTAGSGEGQFEYPNGLKVKKNKVYVIENSRVQVFDSLGNFIKSNYSGGGDDIDVDSSGNIFVSGFGDLEIFNGDFQLQLVLEPPKRYFYGFAVSPNATRLVVHDYPIVKAYQLEKLNHDITFNVLPIKKVNDPSFSLTASSSREQPISYVSSNVEVATVLGNVVTIIGAGTTQITASSDQNTFYNASTPITQQLIVEKLSQTITFEPISVKLATDIPFDLSGNSTSNLPITFVSSNEEVATISGKTVTIIGGGTSQITALNEGDEYYDPALPVTRELVVEKVTQTITFHPLDAKLVTDESFRLTYTNDSGLPVSFTSANPDVATISGDTVTITGGGITEITASNNGNSFYNAASPVTQTLTVSKLTQTVSFELPEEPKEILDAPFELNATASSGLPVTFISSAPEVASVSGNTITITGMGTTTITSIQQGNNFYEPDSAEQSLFVIARILELSGDLQFENVKYGGGLNIMEYEVKNVGNAPLFISDVNYPSFFSGTDSLSIPANGTGILNIRFSPESEGDFSGEIILNSNAHFGTD